MHSTQLNLAPHNPKPEELEFLMEGKHHELRGWLC